MSFMKGLKKGVSVVTQATQEAAATAKLEADVRLAESRFNSMWGKLQDAYPVEEAEHAEVRDLLQEKRAGVSGKNALLIDTATKRLEVVIAKVRMAASAPTVSAAPAATVAPAAPGTPLAPVATSESEEPKDPTA